VELLQLQLQLKNNTTLTSLDLGFVSYNINKEEESKVNLLLKQRKDYYEPLEETGYIMISAEEYNNYQRIQSSVIGNHTTVNTQKNYPQKTPEQEKYTQAI